MGDVTVIVESIPARETLASEARDEMIHPGLLGLFVGPSLKDRESGSPVMMPPTVFIYQRNLERICQTREELIHEIRITLYHELGHYLGLTEEELEARGLE